MTGPRDDARPLVSVVVPTFRSARFLPDMIHSLRGQTFRDVEVIVSDGGSDDGTLELLRSSGLPNLVIDSRPDEGVPDALNRGFAWARGDVLCWMNSDDAYATPDALAAAAQTFVRDPGLGWAYGHSVVTDEAGTITRELYAHLPRPGLELVGNNANTGALFFRRRVWAAFPGFSLRHRYGFEYGLRRHLWDAGGPPALIDHMICVFRVHEGSLSQRFGDALAAERDELQGPTPAIGRARRLFERSRAQLGQGTLWRSLRDRVGSPRRGRHWRDVFDGEVRR